MVFVFFIKIWNPYLLIAFETYGDDWQLKFLPTIRCSPRNWNVLLTKTNLYKHTINSWFIVNGICGFSSFSVLFFVLFLYLSVLKAWFLKKNLNPCFYMWPTVSLVDYILEVLIFLYNRIIIIQIPKSLNTITKQFCDWL